MLFVAVRLLNRQNAIFCRKLKMTDDLLPESLQARAIRAALDVLQQAGVNADFGMDRPEIGSYRITLPPVLAIYTAVVTLQAAGIDATLDTDARTGLPIQITLRTGEPTEDFIMAAQVCRLQAAQAAQVVAQAKRGRHG